MKKVLLPFIFLTSFVGSLKAQTPFTILNQTGTNSLTCVVDSIKLNAVTQVIGNVSFHWSGPATTFTGSSITLHNPGSYTVTASDSLNVIFGTQYFTISINTVAPVSSVNPAIQNIACNTTVGAPVTANGSGNVTHTFMSPYGGSVIVNNAVGTYTPLGTGTYTHILLNNVNGCKASSTFTLASAQGFPTFSVVSPANFTLGCNSKSVIPIQIVNANTTPSGGSVSYTFMTLSENNPAPPGILSPFSTYTVNVPGIYYVVVRDNSSNCSTQIPISIISNTVAPNISAVAGTQTLDCNIPSTQLIGSSSTANTSYNWSFVGTPGNLLSQTITATANMASPSLSLVNIYTLTVTDNNNACTSTTVIPVYQNIFAPLAVVANPNIVLTCETPTVMLTNQSTSSIPPPFSVTLPVVGYAWFAPAPQASLGLSSSYVASVAGVYTLVAKDMNNGCVDDATTIVMGGCNTVGIGKTQTTDFSIHVYPNPGNGIFGLKTEGLKENSQVKLYNCLGMLIKQQTLSTFETPIDISSETNGMYILNIFQNQKLVYTSKIIKQ